jgi:broad specificity phosphatase PhoE
VVGDGLGAALGRVLAWLAAAVGGERQASSRPWSIVVAHDGVFKVTLLTLFDLPLDRFWMWRFDLCGFTVVELAGGRPVVRAHNLTAHLAPLHEEELAAEARAEARRRSGAL